MRKLLFDDLKVGDIIYRIMIKDGIRDLRRLQIMKSKKNMDRGYTMSIDFFFENDDRIITVLDPYTTKMFDELETEYYTTISEAMKIEPGGYNNTMCVSYRNGRLRPV